VGGVSSDHACLNISGRIDVEIILISLLYVMAFSQHNELLEGVVNQLIDEEALGVCFEMHRAIKLGYYELLYPDDR
jgi:hypothetical protein